MQDNTVAILGAGSMGTAILSGMLSHGIKKENIKATARKTDSAEQLAKKYGVTAYATDYQPNANSLAVEGAQIILVAVKPVNVIEVLKQIRPVITENALVISVAAGITTATIESYLPGSVAVVRAMPNTPALIRLGLTGIAAGSRSSAEQLNLVVELFNAVGKSVVLDEDKIDALSTISGSGPAYVFYFMEEFIKTAKDMGFSQEDAYLLVTQTFLGASELITQTQGDPAELRRAVTSPNGTTMKAVAVLEEGELHNLFLKATTAALARAKEISQEQK
ncbi:MAG: pyrroline-5-carboxylate reductase [Actinobacteria bacterium]|nr:pyrroline-5-carboxylate reductase [Actinomycetota bacterium]